MDRDVLEFGGLLVFFVCLMGSRWVGERAVAALDDDMKLRLIDAFAKQRKYGLLPVIGLTVLAFLPLRYFSGYPAEVLIVFMLLSCGLIAGAMIATFRKLSQLGAPRGYIKSYFLGRALVFGGMGFYVVCLAIEALQANRT